MEILLAVVWYLALLVPGNYYTEEAIYDIALENRTQVEYVIENHRVEAADFFFFYSPEDGGVLLPAYWEKEPVDHSDDSWIDPFDEDIRRDTTGEGSKGGNGDNGDGGK